MNTYSLELKTEQIAINEIEYERTFTYDHELMQALSNLISKHQINIQPLFVSKSIVWDEKKQQNTEKYTLISNQLLLLACLHSEIEYANVIVIPSEYCHGYSKDKINIKIDFVAEMNLINKIQKTEIPFVETDLPKIVVNNNNYEGKDLRGFNFEDANLKDANFKNANLENASFEGAILSNADFSNANLTNANLMDTRLNKANLSNANLSEANLISAYLDSANLTETNLTKANLIYANLKNANLSKANLSNAILRKAEFNNANLTDTNLTGVDLDDLEINQAIVNNIIFDW